MKLSQQICTASSANVAELQDLLKQNGFDAGPTDGNFSAITDRALRDFQASMCQPPNGETSNNTFDDLRRNLKGSDKAERLRQSKHVSLSIPDGTPTANRIILELAIAQMNGHVEEMPLGSNGGPSVDRYTKRWRVPWSACFLSWCINEASWFYDGFTYHRRPTVEPYLYDASSWKARLMKEDRYVSIASGNGNRLPEAGDIFFIHSENMNGHCGFIVEYREEEDEEPYVLTIEGNTANGVRSRRRLLKSLNGYGMCYPMVLRSEEKRKPELTVAPIKAKRFIDAIDDIPEPIKAKPLETKPLALKPEPKPKPEPQPELKKHEPEAELIMFSLVERPIVERPINEHTLREVSKPEANPETLTFRVIIDKNQLSLFDTGVQSKPKPEPKPVTEIARPAPKRFNLKVFKRKDL